MTGTRQSCDPSAVQGAESVVAIASKDVANLFEFLKFGLLALEIDCSLRAVGLLP